MKYVVSGATSGTGNVVARRLVEKFGAQNLLCLVRPTSDVRPLQSLGLPTQVCDITEPDSYRGALGPGTIYLDMTHPKHYHKSLEAVRAAGVERAYFVTTTGIFSSYNQYSAIYKENEAKIRASGITYTILRPSMIYGSLRDKNMNRLIRFLTRAPVFPIFGTGRSLMQPVYVEDLAAGIVSAIGEPRTENQEYNLAGPQPMMYRQIVRTIARQLGRKIGLLYVNMTAAAGVARVGQRVPGFPVTQEQVLRLLEDKAFDISKAQAELNYQARPFAEGIRLEIAEMRAAGVIG